MGSGLNVPDESASSVSLSGETWNEVAFHPDDSKIEIIPKTLYTELWKDSGKEIEDALEKLSTHCFDETENANIFHTFGGYSIILGVMKKWYMEPILQAKGSRAINVTAYKHPSNRQSFLKAGAFDIVLLSMKNFPTNSYVQGYGCSALCRLTVEKEGAKQFVEGKEGLDIVIRAMKAFPLSKELQKFACSVLYHLSLFGFTVQIVEAGGLVPLASAIETFKVVDDRQDVYIQKAGRQTIKLLLT
jgi:hypothetical protein